MSLAGKRKRREPSASTPPEIWGAILERLDARSLANARLVCREWLRLATPLVRPARVREFLIEPIATLRGHRSAICSIAPWADMFVTVHADASVRLWSSSGASFSVLDIRARAAFGWGDALVALTVGPRYNAIELWKASRADGPTLRSGRRVGIVERFRILKNQIDASTIVVDPWGDRLVVPQPNGDVETWDERGAVLSRMIGHREQIWCSAALGEKLATAGREPLVRIWNKTGACVAILERDPRVSGNAISFGAPLPIHMLAWGERLAVEYNDGLVCTWADSIERSGMLSSEPTGAGMYAWGGMLVTRASAFVARVWDEVGGVSKRPLNVNYFSHLTHGMLATYDAEGIRVWDVPE